MRSFFAALILLLGQAAYSDPLGNCVSARVTLESLRSQQEALLVEIAKDYSRGEQVPESAWDQLQKTWTEGISALAQELERLKLTLRERNSREYNELDKLALDFDRKLTSL